MMCRAYMGGTALNRVKHGLYGSVIGCNNHNSLNYGSSVHIPSLNGKATGRTHQSLEAVELFQVSRQNESTPSSMESDFITKLQERSGMLDQVDFLNTSSSADKNWRTIQEMQKGLKRKTLDPDCNLDLNLSLKLASKDDDELEKCVEGCEVDGSLSLSLSSSSSSKLGGSMEGDGSGKHARMASTLDLTLWMRQFWVRSWGTYFSRNNMLKDTFLTCIQGNSSHYLIFCCCFFVNLFCMQNRKLVVGFSLVLPMNRWVFLALQSMHIGFWELFSDQWIYVCMYVCMYSSPII